MTELSFLIDLLLNHKLPKPTKEIIAERIKQVEAERYGPMAQAGVASAIPSGSPRLAQQSPSTLANLEKHGIIQAEPMPPIPETPVVGVVAHTAAAAKALSDRNALVNQALSGRAEQGRTSPRKF